MLNGLGEPLRHARKGWNFMMPHAIASNKAGTYRVAMPRLPWLRCYALLHLPSHVSSDEFRLLHFSGHPKMQRVEPQIALPRRLGMHTHTQTHTCTAWNRLLAIPLYLNLPAILATGSTKVQTNMLEQDLQEHMHTSSASSSPFVTLLFICYSCNMNIVIKYYMCKCIIYIYYTM